MRSAARVLRGVSGARVCSRQSRGMYPQAAMRNCPETASLITERG
jgi:hypothetical protein